MRTRSLMAGAFALLLQLVAWAAMPALLPPVDAADNDGTRIVICTPDGYKTIVLDEQGLPVDAGLNDDATLASYGGSCPLCPLIAGLAVPTPFLLAAPIAIGRHGPEILPGAHIAAGWFLSSLQARAPPSIG